MTEKQPNPMSEELHEVLTATFKVLPELRAIALVFDWEDPRNGEEGYINCALRTSDGPIAERDHATISGLAGQTEGLQIHLMRMLQQERNRLDIEVAKTHRRIQTWEQMIRESEEKETKSSSQEESQTIQIIDTAKTARNGFGGNAPVRAAYHTTSPAKTTEEEDQAGHIASLGGPYNADGTLRDQR